MWAACPRSTATGGCPGSEAGAPRDHGDLFQSPLPKAGGLLFALGAALRKSGAACEQAHGGLWNFQESKSGPERPRKTESVLQTKRKTA